MELIDQIISSGGAVYQSALAQELLGLCAIDRGLPIGTWFSQWSGALYLDGLDHLIKRKLKIPGYLRYGDDLALFHESPKPLRMALEKISTWLERERGLKLNPKHGVVEPSRRACNFLGCRVSPHGVRLSRRQWKQIRRKLRKAKVRGPEAFERTAASYQGMLQSVFC